MGSGAGAIFKPVVDVVENLVTAPFAGRPAGAPDAIRNEQANRQREAQRQASNDQVFRLAQSLTGSAAGREEVFDVSQLQFQGSDPREQQLQNLVNLFQRREFEILQRRSQPGSSQTFLSLVE